MNKHQLKPVKFLAAFLEANDLCKSALAIAVREGKETNWMAFRSKLRSALRKQYKLLYKNKNK